MTTLMAQQDVESAFASFGAAFPAYADTGVIDEIRAREFSRLDRDRHVYLDYTGGGLYGACQVRRHADLLLEATLGNPHSTNPTSSRATELVERARRHVHEYFNASPDEYAVIFTGNATQGLKLVGESYPFGPGDRFLLTFDNHNSVNGIREFDRAHGAETVYIPMTPPELRIDCALVERYLDQGRPGGRNLFAYPAQSNFSGVQHPLEWIEKAQARGWDVLLDAAAFVPTNRLDFARWHPDYATLSFYKMFGYPTGVGALIARHEALAKLRRPWFAGGTITVASVQADDHRMAPGNAAFEDGTLDYASIPAVHLGLEFLESVGIDRVHQRVHCLAGWLLQRLLELRHANGEPLVMLYGPAANERRGGTVTLNFRDPEGKVLDHQKVEERAARRGISLRTGCFCNPGAGEAALGLEKDELVTCFTADHELLTLADFQRCIDDKSTGAVRVSVGLMSNFRDVHAFVEFARGFLG